MAAGMNDEFGSTLLDNVLLRALSPLCIAMAFHGYRNLVPLRRKVGEASPRTVGTIYYSKVPNSAKGFSLDTAFTVANEPRYPSTVLDEVSDNV